MDGRKKPAMKEQVPAKFKEAVKADLESLGLDENGNPV